MAVLKLLPLINWNLVNCLNLVRITSPLLNIFVLSVFSLIRGLAIRIPLVTDLFGEIPTSLLLRLPESDSIQHFYYGV